MNSITGNRDRQQLDLELDERALRSAIWIGIREAQRLGLHSVAGQLSAIFVFVDGLRELRERAA
ncbi:MAG: hypothetical protein ABJA98_19295 [Acidobacteriota bacterium]